MTPDRLAAIRAARAPDLTLATYARALGYRDPNAYGRMERGARAIPTPLAKLAEMVERHGLPDDWTAGRAG